MVILETVETLYFKYKLWFIYFELFSVTIFSLEYISRFWSCVENKAKSETNGIIAKIRNADHHPSKWKQKQT